jgi:hypothetical protein
VAFQGLPPELAQVDSCRLFAASVTTGHCLVAFLLVLLDFDEFTCCYLKAETLAHIYP